MIFIEYFNISKDHVAVKQRVKFLTEAQTAAVSNIIITKF